MYQSTPLITSFYINEIYTIHYFEYMSDFDFAGESHDFWEFIYVYKGEVNIMADRTPITLKKGDIAFHKPNEFHRVTANGVVAPDLVVISFTCNSHPMNFFRNKVLRLDSLERNLLAEIVIEARATFSNPLDDPYSQGMIRGENAPFASEQLIKLYLQEFLIHLVRRYSNPLVAHKKVSTDPLSKTSKERSDEEIFVRITDYLEKHLQEKLTIDRICKDNLYSRSKLQKMINEREGVGIEKYFVLIKIKSAKQMIRDGQLNFTQIAEKLGYTSIHYFSRQFRKVTGMTPTEYSSSVKARSERPRSGI
ncbi:MAG TPA: AraC family transcriptional regulator [Lachnospiraceae bacterium]|nr:AraC family transcriptional regulator [Lachnospiraceae bacterium]